MNRSQSQPRTQAHLNRGLRNLGNTCYMNATLQCMVNSDPFFQLIANNKLTRGQNNFLFEMGRFFRRQYRDERNAHEDFAKMFFDTHGNQFPTLREHDAAEFLGCLMDEIGEAFPRKELRSQISMGLDWYVECPESHSRRTGQEQAAILELALGGKPRLNVMGCFDATFVPCTVKNVICERCNNIESKQVQYQVITNLPDVLIVQLMRFQPVNIHPSNYSR